METFKIDKKTFKPLFLRYIKNSGYYTKWREVINTKGKVDLDTLIEWCVNCTHKSKWCYSFNFNGFYFSTPFNIYYFDKGFYTSDIYGSDEKVLTERVNFLNFLKDYFKLC